MKFIKIILSIGVLLSSFTAQAEVAVIVNAGVEDTLTSKEISRIFLGKSKKFPSGNSATPINLSSGDATREAFEASVLKKSPKQLKSYWSKQVFTGKGKPPKEHNNATEVINQVKADPSIIGYVDASAVTADVKVIASF